MPTARSTSITKKIPFCGACKSPRISCVRLNIASIYCSSSNNATKIKLLGAFDAAQRSIDGPWATTALDDYRRQAFTMLTSPGAMLLPLRIPGTPYARFLAVSVAW